MAVNVKPLADRVLVQPLEEKEVKKAGSSFLTPPKKSRRKAKSSPSAPASSTKGKKIEFTVKKGDKVLISKYGGTEIKVDGENYLIMREDDILGILG